VTRRAVIGGALGAGEGRKDALIAILGGIVGAVVFTFVYGALEPVLFKPLDLGKITLARVLHLNPVVAAVGLTAVFIGAIALLPTERGTRTAREDG
jgi:hypothetical protein